MSRKVSFPSDPSPSSSSQPADGNVKQPKGYESGTRPDAVYDVVLPAWRAATRRWLVRRLREESPWLADVQRRMRTPFLDRYFFWTAIFGTHTFFMTVLPMFFWFGSHEKGRALLYVTGLGIYISSYAKDLVCTPRPYSPPVTRLSMSTHGQEYGFPSSHSTNSVGTGLVIGGMVAGMGLGWGWTFGVWVALIIYAGSVTLGRLYCGMHSTADCIAGVIMGIACWGLWEVAGPGVEAWVEGGHWTVPVISVAVCLLLVHKHPEPVDDCPCFEDAIAILSVIMGSFLVHWYTARYGFEFAYPEVGARVFGLEGWVGEVVWLGVIVGKMISGIAMIFLWRLVAKRTCHMVLPSVFRAVSGALHFTLPTRKHYKAATEYQKYPEPPGLHLVPTFEDLPSEATLVSALPAPARAVARRLSGQRYGESMSRPDGKVLGAQVNGTKGPEPVLWDAGVEAKKVAKEVHYDIDVLTKVIVYSGIFFTVSVFQQGVVFRWIDSVVYS